MLLVNCKNINLPLFEVGQTITAETKHPEVFSTFIALMITTEYPTLTPVAATNFFYFTSRIIKEYFELHSWHLHVKTHHEGRRLCNSGHSMIVLPTILILPPLLTYLNQGTYYLYFDLLKSTHAGVISFTLEPLWSILDKKRYLHYL